MRKAIPSCICVILVFAAVASAQQHHPPANFRYRIAYATYLGGSGHEQAREVFPLPDGSVWIGAQTNSSDAPVTEGAVQPTYGGETRGRGHPGISGGDCYVAHLSADGRKLLAATYFGGSKQERNVYGMAIDRAGNVIISSATRSSDLATTKGSYQPKYGGGKADMFVAKLSPDSKRILWCTYVGASKTDWPRGGIGLDAQENVFIVGSSDSPDFPVTAGVYQRRLKGPQDAAIVKLSADGSKLLWATRLGGSNREGLMGVRVDALGNVHVIGHTQSTDFPTTPGAAQPKHGGKSDCYFAKLSPDGKRLLYATYLGGKENEFAEHRPRLLADGTVLCPGVTGSADFPTTPGTVQRQLKGNNDGFLARLSADGKRFVFSTLLGGSSGEFFLMPTPDALGNIFIVGTTRSRDFPVTATAVQKTYGGASGKWDGDGVLAVLSGDGKKLLYATYLGGSRADLIRSMAFGYRGEIYLVGNTSSKDFPVTPDAFQKSLKGKGDAFIVKLVPDR